MYKLETQFTEQERKQFAVRLITLAQLIKSLEPAQYQHDTWIRSYDPADLSKTVGCALGLAVAHSELFPDLGLTLKNREAYGWGQWWYIKGDMGKKAEEYFGPDSFQDVFWAQGTNRYGSFSGLTRGGAINRLLKMAREKYGYEPA